MGKYKTRSIWARPVKMIGEWWGCCGFTKIVFGKIGVALIRKPCEGFDDARVHVAVGGKVWAYLISPRPTKLSLLRMAKKLLKQHEESNDAN